MQIGKSLRDLLVPLLDRYDIPYAYDYEGRLCISDGAISSHDIPRIEDAGWSVRECSPERAVRTYWIVGPEDIWVQADVRNEWDPEIEPHMDGFDIARKIIGIPY